MPRKRKSWVWQFCKIHNNGKNVICNICNAIISYNGSSLVINKHLKYVHKHDAEAGSSATEMGENERYELYNNYITLPQNYCDITLQ